jgi:hypothetical protein
VFQRGSNVLEYWLDHAEGFEVRFRRGARGHVESVVVDPGSGRARGLIVRKSRTHRTRFIPAHSIVAIDPFAEVLVTRRTERSRLSRTTQQIAQGTGVVWDQLRPRVAAFVRAARSNAVTATSTASRDHNPPGAE